MSGSTLVLLGFGGGRTERPLKTSNDQDTKHVTEDRARKSNLEKEDGKLVVTLSLPRYTPQTLETGVRAEMESDKELLR